jgi:uncharacterized RDD family membrane protein YckC
MTDLPPPPPPPPPPPGGGAAGLAVTPPLAELSPRVVAFLIDWVAIYVAMFIAFAIIGGILGAVSDALGALFSLVAFMAYLGFWFWQIYQEGTTGQTIGKKLQHVKLVGLENGGQPVGFAMAFVRNFVNGICGLFWLFPFFDAQRQTLGDKVSKSVVVPA